MLLQWIFCLEGYKKFSGIFFFCKTVGDNIKWAWGAFPQPYTRHVTFRQLMTRLMIYVKNSKTLEWIRATECLLQNAPTVYISNFCYHFTTSYHTFLSIVENRVSCHSFWYIKHDPNVIIRRQNAIKIICARDGF